MAQKWNGSAWVNEDPKLIKAEKEKKKKIEDQLGKIEDAKAALTELEKDPNEEEIASLKKKIEDAEEAIKEIQEGKKSSGDK